MPAGRAGFSRAGGVGGGLRYHVQKVVAHDMIC
jgi:hypothetical protein